MASDVSSDMRQHLRDEDEFGMWRIVVDWWLYDSEHNLTRSGTIAGTFT